MFQNLFNNVILLYETYDFHLRTAFGTEERVHFVNQFYQSRPTQGTLPIVIVFSRKVVGWSMSNRIDRFLVMSALAMAVFRCRPKPGLIFHSDKGSQYCSRDVQRLLLRFKMLASMSGRGNCYDNAVAESFFHTFKNDLIRFEDYLTREEAKRSIFEYIEAYYNRIRRHSYLGYLSPEKFEQLRKIA
jgi:putative transposase